MPIYEYECTICGRRFERIEKIGTDAVHCPFMCSMRRQQRVFEARRVQSVSNFQVKGYRAANGYASKIH